MDAISAPHSGAPGETAAALAVGAIALLMPGLQPILLGELVAHHRITLEGVGLVAMGEIIALGLGVILGNSLLSLGHIRRTLLVAAAVAAALDVLTVPLQGDLAFAAVRTLCGLAEGVLVWVTTCFIVRTAAPDRLAGVFLTTQTLAQAAMALLLAVAVIPYSGWQGGFVALAVLSGASLLLAPALSPRLAPLVEAGSGRPAVNLTTGLTLLVAFCQMGAIGSLWAYLDPLGRRAGLGAEAVQMLISVVLGLQVVGGTIASLLVRRGRAVPILMGAALLQALIALAIYHVTGAAVARFAALCGLFGFLWLFSMPFHIRLALSADATGRVAVLVPGIQLLGVACGPLLASAFVANDDPRLVPAVCGAFAISAVGFLAAIRNRSA
jgi:predicted MFS family arabinose efflux permease